MNLRTTPVLIHDQPVVPGKIVCVGRNYVAHIKELNNEEPAQMVVFMKPASAVTETLHACLGEPLHYEAEICLMSGEKGFKAVAVGLDLTKRDLQSELKQKGLPWERAKAFDGSALFSEFVNLQDSSQPLEIKLLVNGEIRQQGSSRMMLYPPDNILAELNSFISLQENDIVMTGTPSGVGQVNPGDHFSGQILQQGKVLTQADWSAV